jgi:cytochrome c
MKVSVLNIIFILSLFFFVSKRVNTQEIMGPSSVTVPSIENLPKDKEGAEVRYGFEILANTSKYFGPNGSLSRNNKTKMSCRNCHMDVGRKEFGNSWLDTHAIF